MIRIDTSELDRFSVDVGKLSDKTKGNVQKVLNNTGFKIETKAKGNVPVDTGLLKSRLDTKFKGSNVNRKIDVGILNNKDRIATYGYYQEYGSRNMTGKKWIKKSWQKSIKEASNKIGEVIVNEILK